MRNVLWVVGTFLLSILHASAEADSTITLNAVKYYKPSRHEDGVYNTSSLVEAIIPRDIAVISGNAGNSLAVLNFDRSRCIYTGGSSKPNPLSGKSNSTDIAAGSKYSLKMCIPSLVELLERLSRRKSLIPKEGDSFNVKKSIVLHVVNGDSSLPTKAQVEIVLRGEPVLPKLLAITAPEGGTGSSNDISYVIQGII